MLTLSGYQLTEQLHEGGNSSIYRAIRKADNLPVILKILTQEYPPPEQSAWLKREYEITQNLNDIMGVVDVYALSSKQNYFFIVLEDFGATSIDCLKVAGHMPLNDFLRLAIKITAILGELHQRHLIHKDINPSNIILNSTTKQVKLIDFGISTILSRETSTFRHPNLLEGTLAYLSPEQTGRMNRSIDYRTDFYSLGVTFYELLTGQLPFIMSDALEIVHCHIAKQPVPPYVIKPEIPQVISKIVLKLMAKNAEDRYQSAYGIKNDLEECLRQWQATGQIPPFPLARADVSDRFEIPQKLYGRETEMSALVAGVERISQGASEMMLIVGYSGIGKSAIVQEVYKPLTRQHGYFISGKFDQFQRNIPYLSLIQAFRALMRQLLTENEAAIAIWREKLTQALGANGQIIIEVIPEIEMIIGPQQTVPELGTTEAQNRFNLVFQNFIKVFTQPEHPLIIFLDDLQWADVSSLKLIELLMTDIHYFFLIGAYRNNEVNDAHPLMLTLDEIKKANVIVNQIVLSPLALPHVTQLIADIFKCEPVSASTFAELVHRKTNGNPFFVIEFLKFLYANVLLTFDYEQAQWQWDIAQIQAQQISNNVVELITSKVQKLPSSTLALLKLAACIGNQFDLERLTIASDKSSRETATNLWDAIAEGFILPLSGNYKLMEIEDLSEKVVTSYKFAHDRIQQAVYSLIHETDKQAMHLRVGQLLLQNTPSEELDHKIFYIINQLNQGQTLINQHREREELARLNLQAGKKAKTSVAYQAALNYLQIGLGLLGEDNWQQYDLALALHLETVEVACLSGNYERMEQLSKIVLKQAKTLLDKVKIYEINILAYFAQQKISESLALGLQILKQLEVQFPEKISQAEVLRHLEQTKIIWVDKRIEDLIDLPEMTDPYKLAISRLLLHMTNVSSVGSPEMYPLCILEMVNLSLKYGNTSLSTTAYSNYGILLCGIVEDIDASYQFGKLALSLLERFNARTLKAQVIYEFNCFIRHWKKHTRKTLKPLLEVYKIGLETGNLIFTAASTFMYTFHSYWVGKELMALEQEIAKYYQLIVRLRQSLFQQWYEVYQQGILNLLGQSDNPCRLLGDDEKTRLQLYDEQGLCFFYLNSMFKLVNKNIIKY